MASYFRASLADFLATPNSILLSQLTLGYANSGFSQMRSDLPLTWWDDLASLRQVMDDFLSLRPDALSWQILLEFSVPRKSRRLDIVLLTGAEIILVECKRGPATQDAVLQVEEYALLLHYFHQPSHQKRIYPIVVSASESSNRAAKLRQIELAFPTLPRYWIAPTQLCSWASLTNLLNAIAQHSQVRPDGHDWDNGRYFPTPTIIEAALALRSGLKIREIAHSKAAEHDIGEVTEEIRAVVTETRHSGGHAICFLTGVPGSGKTLVGLSLAHLSESRTDAIHFMSGNGPLVAVLQELFKKQAMREGVSAPNATIQARTLIENVHVFAKTYTDHDQHRPPSNHVIIFDEAQRAWNRAQNQKKFSRDYSEPEMLLKIMERHEDWAVVIALVGGGQEINDGEAGLEEWGNALQHSSRTWKVFASPEVLTGGTSTAGRRLFQVPTCQVVQERQTLHLRTSNRSLRADNLARWVNLLIDGNAEEAVELNISRDFPIFLTRSLEQARRLLKQNSIGESRYGLVASSGAARLRAEGLEADSGFHASYPWRHWYLAPSSHIQSSFNCEVFATEFEIQGLELDWIGLCWSGDFIWLGDRWAERRLVSAALSRWTNIRNPEKQQFKRNAYRVLLTRARQGMAIYVPAGDIDDPTRSPSELDQTADYLLRCGIRQIN